MTIILYILSNMVHKIITMQYFFLKENFWIKNEQNDNFEYKIYIGFRQRHYTGLSSVCLKSNTEVQQFFVKCFVYVHMLLKFCGLKGL